MEEEEKEEKKEPLYCVCNSIVRSKFQLLDSKEVTLKPLVTTNLKPAMAISTYLLIITLNVNGLNAPIKRQRVTEWIKNKTHLYAAYKRLTLNTKTYTD